MQLNQRATLGLTTAATLFACAAAYLFLQPHGESASTPQQQAPSPQALFLASAQLRDDWMAQVSAMRLAAATDGMEYGRAGFHLLRPDDDPTWNLTSSVNCSGRIYCWEPSQPKYSDVYYNMNGLPEPGPQVAVFAFCEASLNRVFANSLATLTVESDGASLYRVSATFGHRAIDALNVLLAPIGSVPGFGELDWFGTPRVSMQDATIMKVVLLSDDVAYLPICVQDLVLQAPGPVSVVVANGLSLTEAQSLVDRYLL